MKPVLLLALLLISSLFIQAQSPDATAADKKLVYKLNIKDNIMPKTWRDTKHAFEEADSLKADLVLIHMNTYGGTVLDADSIRTKIINSPRPNPS